MKRFVFCVTGSEKSPPCGETAPIIVIEPVVAFKLLNEKKVLHH